MKILNQFLQPKPEQKSEERTREYMRGLSQETLVNSQSEINARNMNAENSISRRFSKCTIIYIDGLIMKDMEIV